MFPLRRRVMPRRVWYNEEWSRQWLQLLDGSTFAVGAVPRSRPRQPPKGSGKGCGRSQPPHSEVPVPKPTVCTTRTSPAESESEAAAKLTKLEAAYSALDQESPEVKYLKSVIDKTRVRAGHGHPGKRLDECQQHIARAAKRLEIAMQAVVAAVAEQDRLQEEYNIGSARLEELKKEASATPPPMEVDGNTDRTRQLEVMVSELRRERDDLRSHSATSKRAGENVETPQF